MGLTGLTGNIKLAFNAGGYVMYVIEIEGKYFSGVDFEGIECTNVRKYSFCFSDISEAYLMMSFLLAGQYDLNPSELEVMYYDI